jgi:hypothetical protein
MPAEQPPLVGELVPTFADRGCCVVSATDSHGRYLGFLDRPRHKGGDNIKMGLKEVGCGNVCCFHLVKDRN